MEEMYDSEYNNTEEKDPSDHALNLKFTLGFSSHMPGAVHNLTIGDKKVLNCNLNFLNRKFSFLLHIQVSFTIMKQVNKNYFKDM